MGAVYVAHHLRLDRRVALKVIAPELAADAGFRERFERESRTAASIDHPNVVPIYEAGEIDGLLYLAMRYVPGNDLKTVIATRGRLDPGYAIGVIQQVAAALDAAHARGLVHRDVKPGNILLEQTSDGDRAYLSDFGLTKRVASGSALTRTGVVVGTLDYIAPEQLQGGPVDARSDVYALACLLFHTLTGRVPYPRDDDMAKMYAHAHVPPPSLLETLPGVPPGLAGVVDRGMAKDPGDRYVSAGDLGRAAAAAVAGQAPPVVQHSVATGAAAPAGTRRTVVAPLPAPTVPAQAAPTVLDSPVTDAPTHVLPPARRRWPFVALAAGLLAVGVAAGIVITSGGSSNDRPPAQSASNGVSVLGTEQTGGEQTGSTAPTTHTEPTDTSVGTLPPSGQTGPRFARYSSGPGGYETVMPTGSGWSPPSESAVNAGLHRTRATGPGGLELIIDYTPGEAASITPATSCRPISHPQFALADRCVFRGGGLAPCRRSQCVDYLLNVTEGGPGYGVLVGGGDPTKAQAIARRVASSLTPLPGG
jgi:hypothetical protein